VVVDTVPSERVVTEVDIDSVVPLSIVVGVVALVERETDSSEVVDDDEEDEEVEVDDDEEVVSGVHCELEEDKVQDEDEVEGATYFEVVFLVDVVFGGV